MRSPRTFATSLLAAAALALTPAAARAVPAPGAALPSFSVSDLTGQRHHSNELRRPALVIVCTGADARAAAEQWVRAAEQRLRGTPVRVVTVVALALPFFVPDGLVVDRARPETPRARWSTTWLDTRGQVQRVLGVGGSSAPWVLAVDGAGRVVASAHGAPGAGQVERVFGAFAGPTVASR